MAIKVACWRSYFRSKSEPDTLPARPASLYNLTYGRRSGGCTTIPLAAGKAQENGTNLVPG
ncbi:hypothetical protein Rleg5DRAFT_7254 [Rhizobium leguminosarum bv. viciae WSM1455]|nr:hypothetical protein Rleg5DRAFT_7254 [Rhizobium leguminosarum bv. viciae WSM1455]